MFYWHLEHLVTNMALQITSPLCYSLSTVWTVDFETPVYKLYYCLFLPNLPKEKKKREKMMLPVSGWKSAAHTVFYPQK
jgi:hypothetical protein